MANRSVMKGTAVAEQSATANSASRTAPPARGWAARLPETSWRYYVCVGILVLAALTMQSVARALGGYFRKAPLPLKQPLDALDQAKLLPEYTPHRVQPEPLSDELIENLGTEEYLQWFLRDQRRGRSDPTSVVRLFITYHTGQPDLVPHNPKECQAAAGGTLRSETRIEVPVVGSDGVQRSIPVSVLEFDIPQRNRWLSAGRASGASQLVVSYFFYTNGNYVTSRTGVRRAVSNLWDRYAYYSKIELSFTDDAFRRLPDREQAIAATRRLLRKLMPILWDDHYRDWEALKKGTPLVSLDP